MTNRNAYPRSGISFAMRYLIVLVLALALIAAGCSSPKATPAVQTSAPAHTSAPVVTTTTTKGPGLELTILSHDWKRTGESSYKAIYVVGSAKNTGAQRIDYGTINVKWYDAAGNVLGTTTDIVSKLEPGETYRFEIMYIGDTDASEVSRYEIAPGDLDHYGA